MMATQRVELKTAAMFFFFLSPNQQAAVYIVPFLGPLLWITLHIFFSRTCYSCHNSSGFFWPGYAKINSGCVFLIADKVTPGPGAYNPVKARKRAIFGYVRIRKHLKGVLKESSHSTCTVLQILDHGFFLAQRNAAHAF